MALVATMSINAQEIYIYNTKVSTSDPVQVFVNDDEHNWRVVFEAVKTGEAAVSESANITGNKVKWVQLWDGGPKWAVFNVGATSESEYGNYYAWSKTTPMALNGFNEFDSSSYSIKTDIQGTQYDAAKAAWGDNWQMPTKADYEGLITNCTCQTINETGKHGYLFTGKGHFSNYQIFFPFAGAIIRYDTDGRGETIDNLAYYWTSTPGTDDDKAYYFHNHDYQYGQNRPIVLDYLDSNRQFGCSVRAILK